jgi:hypothetical protein
MLTSGCKIEVGWLNMVRYLLWRTGYSFHWLWVAPRVKRKNHGV